MGSEMCIRDRGDPEEVLTSEDIDDFTSAEESDFSFIEAAFSDENSSLSDCAVMLSMVDEALLRSYPRSVNRSKTSLLVFLISLANA